MTPPGRRIATGAGLSVGVICAAPAAAQADDFEVTNLDGGFTSGSLRQAAGAAATNPGADRIVFDSKLSGTITLSEVFSSYSTLYIPAFGGDLEIVGPGARTITVTADGDEPVIVAWGMSGDPAFDLDISGLRISGGNNLVTAFGDNGGGVQAYGAVDLTLSRVTISGNRAVAGVASGGGGVAVQAVGGPSDLTIESSTISGNTADLGGGIYFGDAYGSELSIRNSTLSGNSAEEGGAAFITTNTENAALLNSTVTDNQASEPNGGGGIETSYQGATIRSSIIAGNSDGDGTAPDLDNGLWPVSFSIIGDVGDATIVNGGGNLLNVDANLKSLKNNGGPTDTHAFKKSPAKNKGPSDAPDNDQRGASRKGQPDIGAYEFRKCRGVVVNRVGTSGNDKLKGTKKKDGMLGLGGNDKLKGKKGKDGLCGGRGKDKLIGGPGKDKLNGGPGKDREIQ